MSQNNVKQGTPGVIYTVGDKEIKLTLQVVQDYLVSGNANITMQEFRLFAELCEANKLNPFLKEAYLIKYSEKISAQLVVGKGVILDRATKHPDFDGREQGIIVLKPDGTTEEKRGTFRLPDEKLVGAWAKAHRKNWKYPTYVTVSFDEVAQRKGDGTLNQVWAEKGATMCEKVALVRALRETFAKELANMYEEEEVWALKEKEQRTAIATTVIEQHDPITGEIIEVKKVDLNEV